MTSVRTWLRRRSWSRSFLIRLAVGILAAGVALAFLAGTFRTGGGRLPPIPTLNLPAFDEGPPPDRGAWLDPWLADPSTDFELVLEAIPLLVHQPAVGGPLALRGSLEGNLPDDGRRSLGSQLARALSGEAEEVLPAMLARAQSRDAPRYASYAAAVGVMAHPMLLGDDARPGALFEREAELHDSAKARERAVELYVATQDRAALRRLAADPAYAPYLGAGVRYAVAEAARDYGSMLLWVLPAQYAHMSPTFVVLGVVSGLLWLLFFAAAGGVTGLSDSRLWLCLVAIGLGVLSVSPTLVLASYMEDAWGLVRQDDDLRRGLAFYIASVGFREELCKLLLFLPLAPILAWRNKPVEMLVVASCVGLGFAAEENISYWSGDAGMSALGRFLTANPYHCMMTGLIGLAFCRFLRDPSKLIDFLLLFTVMVIGHGLYDATIALPALQELSFFGFIIFVGTAYLYFGELSEHRRRQEAVLSLTSVFVVGFATQVAATLIAASWELGFPFGPMVVVPGALGAALFVFVFFRQIDEALLP